MESYTIKVCPVCGVQPPAGTACQGTPYGEWHELATLVPLAVVPASTEARVAALEAALHEISHVKFRTNDDMQQFARDALAAKGKGLNDADDS